MSENDVTNILIDGKSLHKTPSNVEVETEIIRNTERALDGTMCIDVVAKKLGLKISWDLLDNADYKKIKNQFPFEDTVCVTSEGKLFSSNDYCLKQRGSEVKAETVQEAEDGVQTAENGENAAPSGGEGAQAPEELFTCYVDAISALPVFIEDNLYWQNVTVRVVEV